MVVVGGQGIPLASILASASPAEVRLAEQTLDAVNVPHAGRGRPKKRPKRLIADNGYDGDPLRQRLKHLKIAMIVPLRRNRTKNKKHDDRKHRRYGKRWKVEPTFARLGNFRRFALRYERHIKIYQAFFHLACLVIVLNRF